MPLLRIGSRESPLALAQTHLVMGWLKAHWPDLSLELKTFKTQGDLILETSLSKVGDKGLFVKELEAALLEHQIDLAVHSMKDMPGDLPAGLVLDAVGPREDARDVLISLEKNTFQELPTGAVVGTSSLRRTAQLKRLRSDLIYKNIRGNLQTRYRKLEEGPYQAIVLAAAGVHRLGWQDRITQYFDPVHEAIPAVCQGILGVEYRDGDTEVAQWLVPLQDSEVLTAMQAERAILKTLQGGCQLPLGAYALRAGNQFQLQAVVLSPEGDQVVQAETVFAAEHATEAGTQLAQQLLKSGAHEILAAIQHL